MMYPKEDILRKRNMADPYKESEKTPEFAAERAYYNISEAHPSLITSDEDFLQQCYLIAYESKDYITKYKAFAVAIQHIERNILSYLLSQKFERDRVTSSYEDLSQYEDFHIADKFDNIILHTDICSILKNIDNISFRDLCIFIKTLYYSGYELGKIYNCSNSNIMRIKHNIAREIRRYDKAHTKMYIDY